MSEQFPSEAGRWYDRNGSPVNEIVGKNGKLRPATIKDARELSLVPSVTSILRLAAKPGLEAWKLKQMMEVAYTTPRLEGESDDDFFAKVILESKEKGRLAAERGTDLHGAIENAIHRITPTLMWKDHVYNVQDALLQYGIDILDGEPERTFVSPIGYGGKLDWHDDNIIIDFKTKDRLTDKKRLAYDEHVYQLAAYDVGVGGFSMWTRGMRLINVFVGAEDAAVRIHEWSAEDAGHGWQCFECLLNLWKLTHDL